jgi:hypothetical protein
MNTVGFIALAKGKRSIWTLLEPPNLAKHPQFCQAKTFGKNGKIGKIGELTPDDDACASEVSA